jgi:phosphate butyryltransferase
MTPYTSPKPSSLTFDRNPMPRQPITTFDELLAAAARLEQAHIVVVSPANTETFEAVRLASERLPVKFHLVGRRETIERGLGTSGPFSPAIEIHDVPAAREALTAALELLRKKSGDILLKGSLDTATLMRAVLDENAGLRTGRLLSDVFVFEYPARNTNKFIMITDGGLNPAPDLKDKVELIRNAVQVAHALGNPLPKVAVLSASEFVSPGIPSTVDAAALAKMTERGQITGCVVDGPLALDNAVSAEAVREKGIRSAVAGQAEILLAPGIEAANSLAKSTTLFAGYRLAHVIVGARIPILIPSRADRSDAKLLSIALGMIMSHERKDINEG